NELILRLLPDGDEHVEIFESYWAFISNLNTLALNEKEYALRKFENQLLDDLGYGIDFSCDIDGLAIDKDLQYDFIEYQGFTITNKGLFNGKMLLQLSNSDEVIANAKELSILKKMNRKRLKSLLGNKPLKSKELFFMN
ncbi:MAG: DNA repair protein RecO C-terminal domain-containing protein, partial [Pseudomonadota bacterium]|nr:DNA repair protein RecO C-terminal domain-containing protein [Pseudomonadota bacterium]